MNFKSYHWNEIIKILDTNIEIPMIPILEKCYQNACSTLIAADKLESSVLLVESIIEKLWEILNIGHWKDVDNSFRKLFSVASFTKVSFL